MARPGPFPLLPLILALVGCSAPGIAPDALAEALAEAPPAAQARLLLDGDRIVATAVPIEFLPLPVQTSLTAVAPDGQRTFTAREHGPRGSGYRIEVHYQEPEHDRSVLIADDGTVLERAHTVVVPDVPEAVLTTATRTGLRVQQAWIVSGPEREEHWEVVVLGRDEHVHVVRTDLAGRELAHRRRFHARIDG